MAYKKDQGRMARMAAYWSLAILMFYGCHSLHGELNGRVEMLKNDLLGQPVPVLGLTVNGAFLIAAAILGLGLYMLHRWQESPKVADLLIETENELRKVTWPTLPEAINSSIVVLITVAVMMVFLAGSDWILGKWFTFILLGSA